MEQPLEHPPLELAPEPSLGRYRLHHELASGGMASVYLASVDTKEGFSKLVALKRIHEHLAKDPEFVEMFLDEARIAARIEHPNVCTVFNFGQVDSSYFIAMEYLMGETLRALMREQARGPRDEAWPGMAAQLIGQACEGLHAAHELRGPDGAPVGLVHRDVSPQNLFVTYGGCLKVVDFGIARAEGKSHHTTPGTIKGKFSYIAPEQLAGSAEVDRRADVWSLGVTLWEMLALRPLFRRGSAVETLTAVMSDAIPKPSAVRPEVPPALDAIVLRALSRKRDERYATAREMGRELAAFCRDQHAASILDVEEHMEALFAEEKAKKLSTTQWVRESSVIRRRSVVANDCLPTEEVTSVARDHTPPAPIRAHALRSRRAFALAVSTAIALGGAVALAWNLPRREAAAGVRTTPTPALAAPAHSAVMPGALRPPPAPLPPAAAPVRLGAGETGVELAPEDPLRSERPRRRERGHASTMRPLERHAAQANELEVPPPASSSPPSAAAAEPAIEAPAAVAPASAGSAAPTSSAPIAAPEPTAAVASQAATAAASVSAPAAPPTPRAPRAAPALDASVSLRNVEARGSLPSSAVTRAIARRQRRLRSCYVDAARRAGRDAAGSVEVQFVIDEMGAARGVTASGGPLPGVAACVGSAFHGLRTGSRPDIGRVNVRFIVRFSPLGSGSGE